jgi:hypothetical protein
MVPVRKFSRALILVILSEAKNLRPFLPKFPEAIVRDVSVRAGLAYRST